MRLFFILFLYLLFPIFGFSQKNEVTIKGIALCRPMSFGDTLPVVGAQVHLEINDSIRITVPTDPNGRYQLQVKRFNGKVNISCSTSNNTKIKGKRNSAVMASRDRIVIDLSQSTASVFIADFNLQEGCVLYRAPEILFKINSSEREALSGGNASDSLFYLEQVMKENPSMVVEITGNADPSEKDKKELSQKRADLIVNALVTKGIEKDRFKTKAMGDEQPLVSEAAIKKAKTKEEKEMLRLKNTRVSWKILSFDYGIKEDPTKKPGVNDEE